jgi:hypothetical protein
MKAVSRTALLFAAICLVIGSADAARWGRPGLWQLTTTMHMDMGGMPAIPPEQLARMKKMGIKIPIMGGGQSIDSKMCVTTQDAENFGTHRYSSADAGCQQASIAHKGNHMIATVVCDGRMKGKGTADVTLIDDAHYATAFTFNGVSHGRPVNMKVSTTAHWLGANCGAVKPLVLPRHG